MYRRQLQGNFRAGGGSNRDSGMNEDRETHNSSRFRFAAAQFCCPPSSGFQALSGVLSLILREAIMSSLHSKLKVYRVVVLHDILLPDMRLLYWSSKQTPMYM